MSSKDLIGVELRFEKYTDVHEMVYLVDNVQKGSPAEAAGLGMGEGHDYVIGSPQSSRFESTSGLSEYLYSNNKTECSLLVYNTRLQAVRQVEITPNTEWGGQGIIGCQIIHGLMTRIPKPKPAEALISAKVDDQDKV